MMDWYSLRVISGKEKKIRDSLLLEVEREGYSAKVDQVFVPSENIVEMRDGKKRVRNKVFFPGYLLIKMDMDKETKFMIENIQYNFKAEYNSEFEKFLKINF